MLEVLLATLFPLMLSSHLAKGEETFKSVLVLCEGN